MAVNRHVNSLLGLRFRKALPRAGRAARVGVHTKVNPDMLKEDVELLERSLAAHTRNET